MVSTTLSHHGINTLPHNPQTNKPPLSLSANHVLTATSAAANWSTDAVNEWILHVEGNGALATHVQGIEAQDAEPINPDGRTWTRSKQVIIP